MAAASLFGANVCDQRVGNYSLVTLLRTGVSLSGIAGLTFSLQRIGTVSVLVLCFSSIKLIALKLRRNSMTAEEIVMGGYAAFGAGDMEALSKV